MALDGIFLNKLKGELSVLIGSHTEKIYQPSKDELVFLLRLKGGSKRLLISCVSGLSRVGITEEKPENPENPPMFCMLMRKYLGSSKLVDIHQDSYERVLTFRFSAANELGDKVIYSLVCEMISSMPNIILCDDGGRIIDSLKHSNIESGKRLIHPGAIYEMPPKNLRLSLFSSDIDAVLNKTLSFGACSLSKALLNSIDGFSPLVSNEVAFRAVKDIDKSISSLTNEEVLSLKTTLLLFKDETEKSIAPYIYYINGEPKDFCFCAITHLGSSVLLKQQESFSSALDEFYKDKTRIQRIKKELGDILKLVNQLYAKARKRMLLRQEELKNSQNREELRIFGELIKANLYRIEKGSSKVLLANYYDENLAEIEIPLNPTLSPAQNAERYFKEYKKNFSKERRLKELILDDQNDILYLESVLQAINQCETVSDIKEICEELKSTGFIKEKQTQKKQKTQKLSSPLKFISSSGLTILVGKNNRQNDMLTLNTAQKSDLWFHAKNIPGSHVILICEGKEPDEQSILEAAFYAATHSKAKDSSVVPVDYTPVKFVKKPSGAKPGMVIYTKNKTVFVHTDKHLT